MSDLLRYDPYNWHWIVGGDESRFWSSATGAYVDELPANAGVTNIPAEEELTDVLAVYGLSRPIFRFPTLKPYQFDAILDIGGMRTTAEEAISQLPEPERTVAAARMAKSLSYERDDPLFFAMIVEAELPDVQVDTLWMWASEL
jgi:hypothetical protein